MIKESDKIIQKRKSDKDYYNLNKEKIREYQNVYRKTRDGGLYSRYRSANNRCKNKSHVSYKYYGEKGIKFLWENYSDFKKDMEKSFKLHVGKYGFKNTTLDRIESKKDYCKENCRWATFEIQMENRKKRGIQH